LATKNIACIPNMNGGSTARTRRTSPRNSRITLRNHVLRSKGPRTQVRGFFFLYKRRLIIRGMCGCIASAAFKAGDVMILHTEAAYTLFNPSAFALELQGHGFIFDESVDEIILSWRDEK